MDTETYMSVDGMSVKSCLIFLICRLDCMNLYVSCVTVMGLFELFKVGRNCSYESYAL